MRSILFSTICFLITLSASAQKWQQGSFIDAQGSSMSGYINARPSGKGPVKNEAFIEFKQDEKTNPIKLSAGELRSFTIGQDSFVVAHPPGNLTWSGKELDFVQVVVDEEIKLYLGKGLGSGKGIGISPGISGGFGAGGGGGYGGFGGGVGISLGGGRGKSKQAYYYGANTAEMMPLTPMNFKDIMSDIMGDEPEVADQIRLHKFNLDNIDKLIEYFKKTKAANGR